MKRLRAVALCGAGLVLAAAWETAHLSGGPQRTLLTFLAFVGLVLAAISLAMLTFAPTAVWNRITERAEQFRRSVTAEPLFDARRLGWILSFLGITTYVVLAGIYIGRQIPPHDNDQAAYLELASEIRNQGGPIECVVDMFAGRFAEANRHPLYPIILSFKPTYEDGKRLSAILGFVSLLWLAVGITRRVNAVVAGLVTILLATNAAFLFVSTLVACEVLVIWLSGIVWLICLPRDKEPSATVPGPAVASLLGALMGLLYLTKGHAVLLIVGLLLWLALRFRIQVAQAKQWLVNGTAFLVGFSVVASPLLVRNVVRYGQPLFNVNGHLLFQDQYVDPVALAEQKTVKEAAIDYLRSHTLGQILRREVKGLTWEAFIIVRSLGPAPWDDARVLFGVVICLACLFGMCVQPGGKTDLLIPWGLVLWVFFAWYVPIAAGERFILPLLVPVLVYAAIGLLRIVRLVWPTDLSRQLGLWLLSISVIWCIMTVVLTYRFLRLEMS